MNKMEMEVGSVALTPALQQVTHECQAAPDVAL